MRLWRIYSWIPRGRFACYFKCSFRANRERRVSGRVPPCASPRAGYSPFIRVISSSMVMSTRAGAFSAAVFISSPPLLLPLSSQGRSRLAVSLPQPEAQSYFLSLRDSCFFFSELAEEEAEVPGRGALEGSAAGGWPCVREGKGDRGQGRDRRGQRVSQELRDVKIKPFFKQNCG